MCTAHTTISSKERPSFGTQAVCVCHIMMVMLRVAFGTAIVHHCQTPQVRPDVCMYAIGVLQAPKESILNTNHFLEAYAPCISHGRKVPSARTKVMRFVWCSLDRGVR